MRLQSIKEAEGGLRKYRDWTGGDKSQGLSGLCKRHGRRLFGTCSDYDSTGFA